MMSLVIANVVRVFGILFCYIFPWYFPWYFTLAIGYLVSLLNSSVATNSQQQCAIQLGGTCRVTYCDLSHAGCWLTIQDTIGTVFFDLFIENKYLHLFSARRFAMSHIIQKYPTHLHFVNSFTSTLTGKFANCAPEISKTYYKIHREHQNGATEISVAQYKLSRLDFNTLYATHALHNANSTNTHNYIHTT